MSKLRSQHQMFLSYRCGLVLVVAVLVGSGLSRLEAVPCSRTSGDVADCFAVVLALYAV